jgi:hypothetical protein
MTLRLIHGNDSFCDFFVLFNHMLFAKTTNHFHVPLLSMKVKSRLVAVAI